MAEVQNGQHNNHGIKLFGATITLQQVVKEVVVMDHHKKIGKEDDRTAEKRPEKILACPRCKSMDTKFCYFNNYNVNQPRHFCKACQRYWTAGGALRNVPIGAGRRKPKPQDSGDDDWPHTDFRQLLPPKRRRNN